MYFKNNKNKEQKWILLNLNNTILPGALLTSHELGCHSCPLLARVQASRAAVASYAAGHQSNSRGARVGR